MKIERCIYYLMLFFAILIHSCSQDSSGGIQLADNRKTGYNLIIPENPSIEERSAAERLRQSLFNVTRANFPILTDATPKTDKEIVLGDSKRISDSGIATDEVEPDGYAIKTRGQKIYMYSPQEGEGIIGAVMDFTKSIGLERFIPNLSVYTIDTTLQIQPIDMIFNPAFSWRSLNNIGADKEDFYIEHKLNNTPEEKNKWGTWGFVLDRLVPQYYQEQAESPTLKESVCLTDEKFVTDLKSGLSGLLTRRKSASHWSVSLRQKEMWCTCQNCRQVIDEEGSPAGPVIRLINRLASDYTGKTWATTVYSDQPPTKTPVAENVILIISTEKINRSNPIVNDEYAAAFRENLDGWLAANDRVMIFDYLTDPDQPLNPSFNLNTIQANLQYYASKGIKMIHMEGSNRIGSDLGPLKTYLAAKLLWDPNTDVDANIQAFCDLYFGDAGQYLKRYIDLQNEQSEKYGKLLTVSDGPTVPVKTHLRPELMDQYNYFFNQAEEVVKGDPELRDRVKLARLPMVYSSLEQARVYGTGKKGFFLNINGRWMAVPGLKTLATNFAGECERMKVDFVMNRKTPRQYEQELLAYADQNVEDHIAFGVAPALRRPPAQNYSGGNPDLLTDGLKGDKSHHYGWIGYESFDMEATLNLPQNSNSNMLSIRFKHDPLRRIHLPQKVSIQVSEDGTNFSNGGSKSLSSTSMPKIETVTFPLGGKSLKSIKIVASNVKVVPTGYPTSGQPAWLFSDEIELR